MKRLIFIPLSLVLLFFAGCDILGLGEDPDAVLLRVANKSNTNFSSVAVSFPEAGLKSYGTVPAGRSSDYLKFETVYRYGYVEVKTSSNMYKIQPIDYVGEKPLKNGYYTYKLNIVDGRLRGSIVQN